MEAIRDSGNLKAIILSFPLNPKKITDKLLEDVNKISVITSVQAFRSNLSLKHPGTRRVKLYLPDFSDEGFSTEFYVSDSMADARLIRYLNAYGLAASSKRFSFEHYIEESHLIVYISTESENGTEEYEESIRALNGLHEFLQVRPKEDKKK